MKVFVVVVIKDVCLAAYSKFVTTAVSSTSNNNQGQDGNLVISSQPCLVLHEDIAKQRRWLLGLCLLMALHLVHVQASNHLHCACITFVGKKSLLPAVAFTGTGTPLLF